MLTFTPQSGVAIGVGRGSFRQGLGPGSSSADVDSIGKIFISAGNVYCCNSGCALLPPYYDQMYVVGYLDASIKCLSASILPDLGNDKGSGSSSKLCAPSSSSDWRVGGLIDVSSGSVLTAIAASEDGNVMAVGEGATGLIYIWKNSALTGQSAFSSLHNQSSITYVLCLRLTHIVY